MNIEDGSIHQLQQDQTLKELADTLQVHKSSLVPLGGLPVTTCKVCNGRGYTKPGLGSKRFVPCECTKPEAR